MDTSHLARTRHALARLVVIAGTVAVALVVVFASAGLATESASEPAGDSASEPAVAEDGPSKLTISSNPHDQFGLVLFGLMGLAALAAGANAMLQLKGRRPQADGSIRWR